jgi:hypothetical protein
MVIIGGIVLYLLSFETKDKTLEANAMRAEGQMKSQERTSRRIEETKKAD